MVDNKYASIKKQTEAHSCFEQYIYLLHILDINVFASYNLPVYQNIGISFLSGPNIALGKTATQGPGSLNPMQGPHLAVDGNNVTVEVCSHTTQGTVQQPAWWQVDLGDAYRITGIKINNQAGIRPYRIPMQTLNKNLILLSYFWKYWYILGTKVLRRERGSAVMLE